jgi:chromosome partitioning protein
MRFQGAFISRRFREAIIIMSAAALITVANTKGGCAKSTTTVILAGEYAAQGHAVHIIDADPKRRVLRWGQAGAKPPSITVTEANGATIRAEIDRARGCADIVLIDVEGTANAALTLAVAYADAVIVPATISPPDTEDGLATVRLVRDIGDAARRSIPHGFLWSIVPPAIRSREMANCEAQVAAAGVPVLGRVYQRTAFSSLFSFMTTLDNLPPSEVSGIDRAKGDAVRLSEAISELLGAPTVEAAA